MLNSQYPRSPRPHEYGSTMPRGNGCAVASALPADPLVPISDHLPERLPGIEPRSCAVWPLAAGPRRAPVASEVGR